MKIEGNEEGKCKVEKGALEADLFVGGTMIHVATMMMMMMMMVMMMAQPAGLLEGKTQGKMAYKTELQVGLPVRYSDLTIFRCAGEIFGFDDLQICR